MAGSSFFSKENIFFFPHINRSLYNPISRLAPHRSPCPSAPSERPEASALWLSSRCGCVGTHRSLVEAPSLSLKPRKSGTKLPPAPLSRREPTQAPSLAAACTLTPKQPAKPIATGTALTSALPPRGRGWGYNTYPNRIWPCFAAWG